MTHDYAYSEDDISEGLILEEELRFFTDRKPVPPVARSGKQFLPDDRTLVEGFVQGNNKAFRTVKAWIESSVCNLSHHSRLTIDDIVGDTIARVFVSLRHGKFRGESSLKTYVQKIARYTVVDAVRKPYVARTVRLADENELHAELIEDDHDSEEYRWGIYLRVLEMLEPQTRALLEDVLIERIRYKEIALRDGISVDAVKQRVRRGKREVARLMRTLQDGKK